LSPGKRIFIDDGLISIVATEIGHNSVVGEVENAGFLGSRKGCNLPDIDIGLPDVSEDDVADIKFAVEQGSFIPKFFEN
jgi:pyruvate kinase